MITSEIIKMGYITTAGLFFLFGWILGFIDSKMVVRKKRRMIAMMKDKTDKAVLEAFYGLEKED